MGTVENKCECGTFRHEHTKRMKEFNDIDLTVYKIDDPEQNKTTFVVSGECCSVCNRIVLSSYSRSVIMHFICPTKPELSDLEDRLEKVFTEDRKKKIRYNTYDLFIWGVSPVYTTFK